MEVLVLTAVLHRHVLQTEERRNTLMHFNQAGTKRSDRHWQEGF